MITRNILYITRPLQQNPQTQCGARRVREHEILNGLSEIYAPPLPLLDPYFEF